MKSIIYLSVVLSILTTSVTLHAETANIIPEHAEAIVKRPEHDDYLCDYTNRKKKAAKTMLHYLNSLFWTKYAPHKWKEKRFGWSPDTQLELTLTQLDLLDTCSADNFKPIFSRFVYSTQDVHTGVAYEDEKLAIIPLRAEYIDGHLLIVQSYISQINVGDEIISVNGDAPLDHLKKVFYGTTDIEQTRPYFFFDHLFLRVGSRLPTPKNNESLRMGIRQKSGLYTYDIKWFVTTLSALFELHEQGHLGHLLKNSALSSDKEDEKGFSFAQLNHANFPVSFVKWTPSQFQKLAELYKVEHPTTTCGDKEYSEEKIATLDWSIVKENGVHVGYIKIESFDGIDFDQVDAALQTLQKKTDCLVVDIRGNPGGVDFSLFGMIMRLTDRPLNNLMISWILDEGKVEMHRRRLASFDAFLKSVSNKAILGEESIEGLPITLDIIRAFRNESIGCIEEWENGYTCTRFEAFRGLKTIPPHPKVRYTKPLFILMDERCASCADMFPAIMRDNDRATLLGRTTSGAGGCVEQLPITNSFGIEKLYFTVSLLLRNNMKIIEDNGVSPDLECKKNLEAVVNPSQEKLEAIRFASKNYKK